MTARDLLAGVLLGWAIPASAGPSTPAPDAESELFRFLDTWTRTLEGWRLIAEHTSAVLKDPPAVRLTREELCAYAGLCEIAPAKPRRFPPGPSRA